MKLQIKTGDTITIDQYCAVLRVSARADGGRDVSFSLEPDEFRALVAACRLGWDALGQLQHDRRGVGGADMQLRRSLYVVADVTAGTVLTGDHVGSIQPGHGLAPKHLPQVLNRRTARALTRGTALNWSLRAPGPAPERRMIRPLAISTARNTDAMLAALAAHEPARLTVALHMGDVSADVRASTLSRMNGCRARQGHLIDDDRWCGGALGMIETPDHAARLEEFIEQMHRFGPGNALRAHPLRSMPGFISYHAILTDMLARRITDAGITHCRFFKVPHLAYDASICQISRSLGLPTLIANRSLFPERYLSMSAPADMGRAAGRRPRRCRTGTGRRRVAGAYPCRGGGPPLRETGAGPRPCGECGAGAGNAGPGCWRARRR